MRRADGFAFVSQRVCGDYTTRIRGCDRIRCSRWRGEGWRWTRSLSQDDAQVVEEKGAVVGVMGVDVACVCVAGCNSLRSARDALLNRQYLSTRRSDTQNGHDGGVRASLMRLVMREEKTCAAKLNLAARPIRSFLPRQVFSTTTVNSPHTLSLCHTRHTAHTIHRLDSSDSQQCAANNTAFVLVAGEAANYSSVCKRSPC